MVPKLEQKEMVLGSYKESFNALTGQQTMHKSLFSTHLH